MQPARLKKRLEEPAAGPPETGTGRRARRAGRLPGRGWRAARLAVTALCLAALPWAALATWWLHRERAALAVLREEQAFLQKSYEEKLRLMTRRLVSAIATQQGGQGASPGAAGEGADDRLADLIARQVELETRQTLLGGLTGQAIAPVLPGGGAQAPAGGFDFAAGEALLDRLDPTRSSPQRRQIAALNRAGETLPLEERIAVLEQSLGRVDREQSRQLSLLGRHLAGRVQEIRAALAELGLDVARVKLPPAQAAMGGPLLPLSATAPGGFEFGLRQYNEARLVYGRWRDLATIVPLRRPLDGDDTTTSNFGMRTDPFTGAPTMHAGMDFRAETGTPIRAPGAGKVLRAEVAGGYGNLIELDHGNGLTSRYGHLSAFEVKPGQIVAAGTVIGRVGSTGRSTGPHLHYETRLDDDAQNPLKFIQVGARLSQGVVVSAPQR